MTRTELKAAADRFARLAAIATQGERQALLLKARNYYEDAGYTGLARRIERFMA